MFIRKLKVCDTQLICKSLACGNGKQLLGQVLLKAVKGKSTGCDYSGSLGTGLAQWYLSITDRLPAKLTLGKITMEMTFEINKENVNISI